MKKKAKPFNKNIILLGIIILIALFVGVLLYLENYEPPQNNKEILKRLSSQIKKTINNPQLYASPAATVRIPILLYHYVENVQDPKDTIRKSLSIPPAVFGLQVQTLKDNGYTFMTTGELGMVLDGKMTLPKNPVILTFDDGYRDFYTDVFPILQQYNAKAVAYIISDFINSPNYLFDWQLRSIISSKLVEVGAHTLTHPDLTKLPLIAMQDQITQSKSALENMFGIPVVSFAYPYGTFNQQTVAAVKLAGFSTAVTTLPGIIATQNNRYFLYRIRPGYRTGIFLLNYLSQNNFKPW